MSKLKVIILEGTDKCGKTTVAEKLAVELNADSLKGLSVRGSLKDLKRVGLEHLSNIEASIRAGRNVIVDRVHLVSTLVYDTRLDDEGMEGIMNSFVNRLAKIAETADMSFVFFTADSQTIIDRAKQDGGAADDLEVKVMKDPQVFIDKYAMISERMDKGKTLEVNVHNIDTTNLNREETYNTILEAIK